MVNSNQMQCVENQPEVQELGGGGFLILEESRPFDPRDLVYGLIAELAAKRQRLEALRASLPSAMDERAVECFCNLTGHPGTAETGDELKEVLEGGRSVVENDIENLLALAESLPERFGDPAAYLGLARLVELCGYNQ